MKAGTAGDYKGSPSLHGPWHEQPATTDYGSSRVRERVVTWQPSQRRTDKKAFLSGTQGIVSTLHAQNRDAFRRRVESAHRRHCALVSCLSRDVSFRLRSSASASGKSNVNWLKLEAASHETGSSWMGARRPFWRQRGRQSSGRG